MSNCLNTLESPFTVLVCISILVLVLVVQVKKASKPVKPYIYKN